MAFLVGGLICVAGQLLLDLTSLTSAHVLVLFVCLGALLSSLGLYEPLVQIGGAGATIPLTGFGHAMVQGIFEEVNAKGAIGILSGAFKNTTPGIVAAIILGIIMALIFNPKG
ncbi:MAG: stage V sporulation protein AE [Firmicutes bacterium]|jgi:stage V sporulation protein AE|nr:stage V sporulation protein AE [Bacillota bacterium]